MMKYLVYSLLSSLLLVTVHASGYVEGGMSSAEAAPHFEPQVAMVCGGRGQYHAQYMSGSGRWLTDSASKVTCLKDKVDILHYCKQVYPDRDITNIVESSHYFRVPNFCRVGHSKCKTSQWVKPYRCLEGSFQSDALLVPEGCLFDHIHNQTRCWEFDRWNTTADEACQLRGMTLKSFAMLLPCGIDVFSGVEFVCCPKNFKAGHVKSHVVEVEEPVALPQVDRRLEDREEEDRDRDDVPPATSAPHQEPTTPAQEVGTRDEYFSRFDPHEEHSAFHRAEQRLEERHRQKVSKIMKEWSDLEERYQDMRAKDPHGAETFKHRMTQRFQKTVEAIEAENEAEKHQLKALHQQRIVAHINEMKREAMTCYTRALEEQQPNTHKVQKCLQKLLRALNKDRHHTVSHYKHLLNSDYQAADRERDSTLQHLNDLDRMVNQSLHMLTRHPDLNSKIGQLMREYVAALRSKDTTPPELNVRRDSAVDTKYSDKNSEKKRLYQQLQDHKNHRDDDEDEDDDDEDDHQGQEEGQHHNRSDQVMAEVVTHVEETHVELAEPPASSTAPEDVHSDESEEDDDNSDSSDEEGAAPLTPSGEPAGTDQGPSASPSQSASDSAAAAASSPLPDQTDAPALAHVQEDAHIAHAQHHQLSHSQATYSVRRDVYNSQGRGVYYTLAFAGVALMAAMVVGIVVLRRRNSRSPHNQGFIEVDQAITPEERHVANMQVNGYENPTYKYFEEK
ncbi:amyloid-beta-like protein isoform X2 [Oratosquilla oratoria]|uniref:amyloid-beta-like protein isoform X2 n=1 Tax=Oratosquilla oratoria TaxID=337810 RepID=UPI003F76F4D6